MATYQPVIPIQRVLRAVAEPATPPRVVQVCTWPGACVFCSGALMERRDFYGVEIRCVNCSRVGIPPAGE